MYPLVLLGNWVGHFSETGDHKPLLDPAIVKAALERLGANFKELTGDSLFWLSQFEFKDEQDQDSSVRIVWGGKYREFQNWCSGFFGTESVSEIRQGTLFLRLMTAYAVGSVDLATFKKLVFRIPREREFPLKAWEFMMCWESS